jgi:hypothetical protein
MASPDEPGPATSSYFDRLEDAWCDGERPNLGDYLPIDPEIRRELLPELARLDLDLSWKTEAPRSVEEYFREFPELLANAEAAVRLIRLEMERRAYSGAVTLDEYRDQFPKLAGELVSFTPAFRTLKIAHRQSPSPRSSSEIARDLNALATAPASSPRPTGSRVSSDPSGLEKVTVVPPRRWPIRRIGLGIGMAASVCLAFVMGRHFTPEPAIFTLVGLEIVPSLTQGPTPKPLYPADYEIVIRNPFRGFATIVRVIDRQVTVFPGKDRSIPVEDGKPLKYGPFVNRLRDVSLRVYVTPNESSTIVVRRVVDEFEKTGSTNAEDLFRRIEKALVASGELKIAVASLNRISQPPNEK